MKTRRPTLLLASALVLTGCMNGTTRVETAPALSSPHLGKAVPEFRQVTAQWEPNANTATLIVEAQDFCPAQQRIVLHRKEITESRASEARWVGVGAAGAVSAMALYSVLDDDPDGDPSRAQLTETAALWAAIAVAAAVVPVWLEDRTERELPSSVRLRDAGVVPCGPRQPLAGSSVLIRVLGEERSAVADAQGRASFAGIDPTKVDVVLVDDWVVR